MGGFAEQLEQRISAAAPAIGEEAGDRVAVAVRSKVTTNINVPTPPFLGTRVVESVPLQQIYSFINRVALFRSQW